MKITFYDGVGSVTGANFLLEIDFWRILVECGLIQGDRVDMSENRIAFVYEPSSINMLFVTHAHLDHVGRIPKLVKEGFNGTIYSTPETKLLAELILEDAVGLLEKEARREGILPLYEMQDVKNAMFLWKTIPYHTKTFFDKNSSAIFSSDTSSNDSSTGSRFSVYLKDAGHILGSTIFIFSYDGKKVCFTGDLGNSPSPLLCDTEPISGVDYVVMESVYGDKNHESKDARSKRLEGIIKDTINRSGTLVIPAFSLERTQVIIYEINKLVESKTIPSIPVFIDSPLATRVTDVYKASTKLFNKRAQEEIKKGDDIFNFAHLIYTESKESSRDIDYSKSPKIVIAGSGMSVGGRVRHHEEIYLPDQKNTVLLVGYQTLGTVGRQLFEGAKKVTIGGNEIEVKAKIESILGYSSHKDSDHLVEFIGTAQDSAKHIFVVMGEPKSSAFLAQRINDEVGVKAICPERGVGYDLS